MSEFYNYKIIQVATEKVNVVNDAIIEIRFMHCYTKNGIQMEKLYVAHIKYDDNEKPYSYKVFVEKGKKKELLMPYIIRALGEDQIKHMERIIKEEFEQLHAPKEETKKYISL